MEKIIELITSGHYRVGDRLPTIAELSEMFKVGKPSIREALSGLATLGIIEIRHGSGTYILMLPGNRGTEIQNSLKKVFTENENKRLSDWMEFRLAIELEIAGLAALRATPEDLAHIQEAYENLKANLQVSDVEAKRGYSFHSAIAQASHNDIFIQIMADWDKEYRSYFELDHSVRTTLTPSREVQILREHYDIVQAIKNHQPEQARHAMQAHLNGVKAKMGLTK